MRDNRRRLRDLHINRMIPNVLTLLALSAGLSGIRFALQEKWELSVLAIFAAGILDGLDGRIARILKGTSRFGAELDSLSDFLSFGVAPAMILYLWAFEGTSRFGWAVALLFCICCALRLARFNTALDDDQPTWSRTFFTGMPSPAGAGLVLLPMVVWFEWNADFLRHPLFVALFMLSGAFLLVSRVRTFSFKRVRVPPAWLLPSMLAVGLSLALLLSNPWVALMLAMLAYLGSIPLSVRRYRQLLAAETARRPDIGPATAETPPSAPKSQ